MTLIIISQKQNFHELNMFLASDILHEDGKHYLDIGANIGIFSLYNIRKGRNCISYEPHPYYFKVLKFRNFFLNIEKLIKSKLGVLKIYEYGVLDSIKFSKLYNHNLQPGSHSMIKEYIDDTGGKIDKIFTIKTTTLDCENDLLNFHSPLFIKIDVEGMEYEVLKGSINIISKLKPDIFIEVRSESINLVVNLMTNYGYCVYVDYKVSGNIGSLKCNDSHCDILFSLKNIDINNILYTPSNLTKFNKITRLFKRILLLRLADLHHLALRKPHDVGY